MFNKVLSSNTKSTTTLADIDFMETICKNISSNGRNEITLFDIFMNEIVKLDYLPKRYKPQLSSNITMVINLMNNMRHSYWKFEEYLKKLEIVLPKLKNSYDPEQYYRAITIIKSGNN